IRDVNVVPFALEVDPEADRDARIVLHDEDTSSLETDGLGLSRAGRQDITSRATEDRGAMALPRSDAPVPGLFIMCGARRLASNERERITTPAPGCRPLRLWTERRRAARW